MSRDHVISLIEWTVIAALGINMLMLQKSSGIRLVIPLQTVVCALPIFVLIATQKYVSMLLAKSGKASGAGALDYANTIKFFSLYFTLSTLQYAIASHSGPLQDGILIAFDQSLGFDWPDFFSWTEAHSWARSLFMIFYYSMPFQVLGILFYVGSVFPRRVKRFTTAIMVSTALTMIVFALVPAAGPFVTYHHMDLPQAFYTHHYLLARTHTLPVLNIADIQGLISFPSFHVASAVLMTWFFRGLGYMSLFIFILNIGMMAGSLVIGGHYLCDVLSGLSVGLITIEIVRAIEGTASQSRETA